ncbi:regulator of G-protein signaling 20 [Puntigrus tetrazona]|uniref:regulator of G-protein signaling 20 n=1 Tax=Puntigrus tetrazona TaxID=1606681 RepID=UPI001C8B07D7|nr:regulator of G-protein signaling 20 [Puntigrus tetrazona]XP_043101676.1 regulator of G-protein signaling 20 [Puntigrus tetrazona]
MGSELEMEKCPPQNAGNTTQVQNTPHNSHVLGSVNNQTVGLFNSPSDACCFCWCCCCSCSCLSVRSAKEERILSTISEKQEDIDTNQMPELTLDEVQAWGESFERLIKSAQGRLHFRQFLKTEFSEENLMFWLACEDLKKETNKTLVEQTVKQIYEDYVSVLSPKEVSLDSRAREVISRNMLEPSSCTFEEAQQQIYTLMQRDSYSRYMNSSLYADLIQSFEQVNES